MSVTPKDTVLTLNGVPVMGYMDYFEPMGIEVDPGEFIEARLSIDGEIPILKSNVKTWNILLNGFVNNGESDLMSYCRWSCDKFQSDVYAYEDCTGGYTIHVAEVHPVSVEHIPGFEPLKWLEEGTVGENHSKYMDAVKQIEYKKIGLEHDGKTLGADNLEDLHGTLVYLRDIGYHVPESAFEMIQEEIEDEQI